MEQMSMEQRIKLLEQQVTLYEKRYGPLSSHATSEKVYSNNSRIALADERAEKLYALAEQGISVKEIAQTYGLSQGSVYQIINGYVKRYGLSSLRGSMRETADERAEKFRSIKLQGVTLEEIGKMYDLTRERVRQIIDRYEKKLGLPSSIPVSRKAKTDAKKADIKEHKIDQKVEKQKQYKLFVPSFQLDAHLVGRFLKQLGDKAVLYGFGGKAKSNPKGRKDGTPYPSMSTPTNIFIGKHVTVHSWVLQQNEVNVTRNQHCHHIDGDITNNMLENLQVLSNVEHGRLTMQEQIAEGTINVENRSARQRSLTDAQVEEIRALYRPRVTPVPSLAKTYGVNEHTIWDALYGQRAYMHVNPATCRVQKKGSKSARELYEKQHVLDFGT